MLLNDCLLTRSNLNVLNVILVILTAMFVQMIASIALYLKHFRLRPSVSHQLSASIAWYGARTELAGLPYHLNARLDQLLMSLLLPPQVLGYYVVAYGWSSMLSFVGGGASMVMLPQSASSDTTDRASILDLTRKFRVVMMGLAAIGVAAAVVSPIGIRVLFGADFVPSVVPAMILCIAGVMLNSNLVIHEMARGLGHPGIGVWAEGVGLIFTLVLLFALLPLWGGVGAAIASLVSYSVVFIVIIFLISRRVGISAKEFLPRTSDLAEYRVLYAQLLQVLHFTS